MACEVLPVHARQHRHGLVNGVADEQLCLARIVEALADATAGGDRPS